MNKRLYAAMASLVLCLSMNHYAFSETLLEHYKAKQKEIALLEKTGDHVALDRAKQELAALFNQPSEEHEPDYSHHAVRHQTYLDTKAALEELNKEIEFLSSVVFKYNVLTLQEQFLLDEIKTFIEIKNASMTEKLQQCYEEWSIKLDDQTTQTFMYYASKINNHIQLISWYFNTIKIVRMRLELLTIDKCSITTLETPVRQMLRDDELQSTCLKIAAKLFGSLCVQWKNVVDTTLIQNTPFTHLDYTIHQDRIIKRLFAQMLPSRFYDSWWKRWVTQEHRVQTLLSHDGWIRPIDATIQEVLFSKNPYTWCDEYLTLSKACAHPETFIDKKVYHETMDALDVLYRNLLTRIDNFFTQDSEEKLSYQIFAYKVLMMKKDLRKFEHYQYDVAKEGIAARHAVLIEQELFKKIATTKEFTPVCDQYVKVIDLYLYNQTKPSLLMFELYKLATHLKALKEQYKLSKIMWLFFKENSVCQVIDDMMTLLEYIALDVSNSKGFEKNSIIEHILAGAWATHHGGLMQKKSFFSDLAHKFFGNNDADVKNQMLKVLGYAGPVVVGAALKKLMPYVTDESSDQKSDNKSDEKTDAHEDSSKILEDLMGQ